MAFPGRPLLDSRLSGIDRPNRRPGENTQLYLDLLYASFLPQSQRLISLLVGGSMESPWRT